MKNKITQFIESLETVILEHRAQPNHPLTLDQYIDKRLSQYLGFNPSLAAREEVLKAKQEFFKNLANSYGK